MKTITVKELLQLIKDATGSDDTNRKVIIKLAHTGFDFGMKEIYRVYSREPNSIVIEVA